jgi:phospholipid/cholesterol/gamma-HCH transport system substrate-binding protein
MIKGIKDRAGDVVAIVLLMVFGLAVTVFILSRQQQPYPDWLPILGDDTFEVRAEFESAQAITPGQGQTVNIAGIKVGDITEATLEEGHAVVTMQVEQEYAPLIHSDATVLLRPRTGLQDMTVEIESGSPDAPPLEEGEVLSLAGEERNIQPDQILASLDADTREYLVLLLEGGAEGLGGNGEELSAALRRFEPTARDLAKINKELAKRRQNIARSIGNFRKVSQELGARDTQLADFVDSSNSVLGAFANQEASLRETLQELPPALQATQAALESGNEFALELGPAARRLIPSSRALGPALREVRPFLRQTVGPIENQIRPFTRQVRAPIKTTVAAANALSEATPPLTDSLAEVNKVFNAIAFNPPGAKEGYLFYLPWLNHNTATMFGFQDGLGPLRRGLILQGCSTASQAEGLTSPASQRFLRTVQQLTRVPVSGLFLTDPDPAKEICTHDPPF